MGIKQISIAYYADEYNYEVMDCISSPVAIGAGAYSYDYYYMYSMLYALYNNWGRTSRFTDMEEDANQILGYLGLSLEYYQPKDYATFKQLVMTSIDNGCPLLCVLPYENLYYHRTYLKEEMNEISHGFLIVNYLESKEFLYVIKDRATTNVRGSIEIQVTESFFEHAWNEAKDSSLAVIKEIDEHKRTWRDLMNDILMNRFNLNALVYEIQGGIFVDAKDPISFANFKRTYSGCVGMIFDGIEKMFHNVLSDTDTYIDYVRFMSEYIEFRETISHKIALRTARHKEMEESLKEEFIHSIQEMDGKLFSYIKMLSDLDCDIIEEKQEFRVPLKEHYNSMAFDTKVTVDTSACFNDRGTYLWNQEEGSQKIFNQAGYTVAPMDGTGMDNISCNGQVITIQANRYYQQIKVIGGSTLEKNQGKALIIYEDGTHEHILFMFSDFIFSAQFNEEIIWNGKAVKAKGVETPRILNAYIYQQVYRVKDNCKIKQILLPVNRNLHIFGITLG